MRDIVNKLKKAHEASRDRKFRQSWDLTINTRGLDLKKPENRFKLDLILPEGRGKELRVCVIADSLAPEARKHADTVITKEELGQLAKDKKRLKRLAAEHDWFFGEATLMADIGKTLGVVLGTRGKMPRPVPPKASIVPFIGRARKSAMVALKDSPVIHIPVGSEDMDPEKVAANARAAYKAVVEKLPKGRNSIKSMYIKLTMGKPARLEAE